LINYHKEERRRPAAKKRKRIFINENKKNAGRASKNNNDALMDKAFDMVSVYSQATGCGVCVYDNMHQPHIPANQENEIEKKICPCCIKNNSVSGEHQKTFPCHEMHVDAIKEANKKGGFHIYNCSLGLLFWTSPIYTEGNFSGALRGSGLLNRTINNTDTGKTVGQLLTEEYLMSMCGNDTNPEELKKRLDAIPDADEEKIQSLAEMLQLCADTLSSGTEDYHEILRRRTEQQEVISQLIEKLKEQYPKGSTMPGYPLDKEKMLIAALRRGDTAAAKQLLNQILAVLIFSNPGNIKYVQLRATELVVLLSRVEINPGKSGNIAMETNNRSLKRVQESRTVEELTDILHAIVERISYVTSSFHGIPHAVALRKAENFILENFTRKISLKEIADVAGLSAPYFSTIFKEEMGENLSKYLNRLRVEKASRMLLETNLPLSEIASTCCFEDQSWFSKIFKAFTGISPGKYRNQGGGMLRDVSESSLSEDFLKTIKEN